MGGKVTKAVLKTYEELRDFGWDRKAAAKSLKKHIQIIYRHITILRRNGYEVPKYDPPALLDRRVSVMMDEWMTYTKQDV